MRTPTMLGQTNAIGLNLDSPLDSPNLHFLACLWLLHKLQPLSDPILAHNLLLRPITILPHQPKSVPTAKTPPTDPFQTELTQYPTDLPALSIRNTILMLKIIAPLASRPIYPLLYHFSNRSKENYYSILQVPRTATPLEIRAQYYELVKKYHPDVNDDHRNRMQLLNEAYAVLSHADKRKEYDKQLQEETGSEEKTTFRNRRRYTEGDYHRHYEEDKPRYHRPHYNQSSWNDINPYVKSFLIGLIFTGVILILSQPQHEPPKQQFHPPPTTYTKQQFDHDFQNSLLESRRQTL